MNRRLNNLNELSHLIYLHVESSGIRLLLLLLLNESKIHLYILISNVKKYV